MFSLRMGWRSCCSYFSAITKGSAGFNPIATIKYPKDPDLGVELDGSVTLEWRRSQTKVISISISPDNSLYFAALLDGIRKRAVRIHFKPLFQMTY